jgi:hypothetical protein
MCSVYWFRIYIEDILDNEFRILLHDLVHVANGINDVVCVGDFEWVPFHNLMEHGRTYSRGQEDLSFKELQESTLNSIVLGLSFRGELDEIESGNSFLLAIMIEPEE